MSDNVLLTRVTIRQRRPVRHWDELDKEISCTRSYPVGLAPPNRNNAPEALNRSKNVKVCF